MTRHWFTAGLLAVAGPAFADDPRPTPLTRPEMKRLLEDMKGRTPRIPLPPLTAEEKAQSGDRTDAGYEGRLRSLYMPNAGGRGAGGGLGAGGQPGGGRDADPALTLDYKFKTQLFWVVSRANNCQYCLGHQEGKLLAAGMTDDEIAALDGDWQGNTAKERAAYGFARQFTLAPHTLTDADVAALKPHFTDLQVLELVLSMAGNNQINRWKEGAGVPQGRGGMSGGRRAGAEPKAERPADTKPHTYDTPTADAFKTRVTKVAALSADAAGLTCKTVASRPPLEPAEAGLTAAAARTPRLPLVADEKARELLTELPAGPVPQWVRLLANFPVVGKARVLAQQAAEDKGDLSPLVKAQVAWVVARQDRAWYAADESRRRLVALGQTAADMARLDGDWAGLPPADRARLTLAKHLAASPVVLTDSEVAEAVKLIGPRDTVQLISYVTVRASFDRITEAAGLTAGQ